MTRERVLVSAHRCGAGDDRAAQNTLAALERAIALGVDFVEFDVRRSADGSFVVAHDAGDADTGAPTYAAVLDAVAGRARAHVDLKLSAPGGYDPELALEIEAARVGVDRLGAEAMLVTIGNDEAVRAVRDWADARGHRLLVGLSLGRSIRGLPRRAGVGIRRSELFPAARIRKSGANLVVAHWLLARLGVARFAHRRGLPLLVWTVDRPGELRHWLRPGRAWLVTTNHPDRALAIQRSPR